MRRSPTRLALGSNPIMPMPGNPIIPDQPDPLPRPGAPVRVAVWVAHLALPVLGLWLLLARPELDARWEHAPSHFWLVLAVSAVNVTLAALVDRAARRRGDARLFLVALAFLAGAGFLGLHALATPGVLVASRNVDFTLATPAGLFVAGLFAVASSAQFTAGRSAAVLRLRAWLRGGLLALIAAWGAAGLLGSAAPGGAHAGHGAPDRTGPTTR
jgi:hypothetical protein